MKKPSKKPKPIVKEEFLLKLAEQIRKSRIEKGFTNYEDFAYEADISRSQYFIYEKGNDMRISTLIKIINGLGMTFEEFVSEWLETLEKKKEK